MANQSAKEAAKRLRDFRQTHGGAILIVLALYVLVQFGLRYSGWTTLHTLVFVGCAVTDFVCYSVMYGHLEGGQLLKGAGGLVEASSDVLYISLLGQATSVISDYCLWILAIVPAVGAYKILAMLGTWMMTSRESEEESEQYLSKTQQKKMKRMEKFGKR